MFFKDIYVLKESNPFKIRMHDEVTVNLALEKQPPCYHTRLSGKVFYKGFPIKNATVLVMDHDCNPVQSTITDENGIYSFCNVLEPGNYKVIASATGYNTSAVKTVDIYQNKSVKLAFCLTKSVIFKNGIVYGKVLEAGSGNPIKDADICIYSIRTGCETVYQTASNYGGQYLIYNIFPDVYEMVVKKRGYVEAAPIALKIEKYGHIILYVDLIRDPDYCANSISGMITFEHDPIQKAAVFLYLLNQRGNEKIVQVQETNEDGLYLFSNVEAGSYLVKGKLQDNVIYEKSFVIE